MELRELKRFNYVLERGKYEEVKPIITEGMRNIAIQIKEIMTGTKEKIKKVGDNYIQGGDNK